MGSGVMKSGKRFGLYSILAFFAVAAGATGIFLWQRHAEQERLQMQRLLEADEGVLIQVLLPGEPLESGSEALQNAVSEFRRDIKEGYNPMKILENPADNEIVMIRILPEGELQRAGALILDNERSLQPVLAELRPLNKELAGVLERLIFRLEAVSGPAFQDDAYRTSLARAEKLWQERSDRIEALDLWISDDRRSRRSMIKIQIVEAQTRLKALSLSDTDARVPLIKRIRELRAELESLPVSLSPAAQALQRYPLLYMQEDDEASLFMIPKDEKQRGEQIELYRKWLTLEKTDVLVAIRDDLQKNATQRIEVRRRRSLDLP